MCAKKHSSGNKSTVMSQRAITKGDVTRPIPGWSQHPRQVLAPPSTLSFFCHLPNMQKIQSSITFKQQQQTEGYIFCFFGDLMFYFFFFPITLCKVALREARVRNRGWNYLTLNRQYNKMGNHQFKKCGVKGRTGLPGKCYYGERAPPPDQWLNIYIYFYIGVHLKQACPGYGPRAKCDPLTDESGPRPVSENTFLVAATRYWIKHADFAISPFTPQCFHAASETEPGPECDLRGVGPRVFSLYLFFFLLF